MVVDGIIHLGGDGEAAFQHVHRAELILQGRGGAVVGVVAGQNDAAAQAQLAAGTACSDR